MKPDEKEISAVKHNFYMIKKAFDNQRVACIRVTRKSDGAKMWALCALSDTEKEGVHDLVPLAIIAGINIDPYTEFAPDTGSGVSEVKEWLN